MEYYFISYEEIRHGRSEDRSYVVNELIDHSPIKWQIENRHYYDTSGGPAIKYARTLISFKEITKHDYEVYKEDFENY